MWLGSHPVSPDRQLFPVLAIPQANCNGLPLARAWPSGVLSIDSSTHMGCPDFIIFLVKDFRLDPTICEI